MSMPPDNHVHSEWSWDARHGSMEQSCERAQRLGLPSIAFTEHLDHTVWTVSAEGRVGLPLDHPVVVFGDDAGRVTPPAFDVEGYLEAVDRCRTAFPDLRVWAGLEVGEPHWHTQAVAGVLAAGAFDRVLGSLHCLPDHGRFQEPADLYLHRAPEQVLREYLAEVARLVVASDVFSILGHIDYPVRCWPETTDPFDPTVFEEEFRHALRATADSGRALEINTVVPLGPTILRWWHDEGGDAVTFGSDAHEPSAVARGFAEAAAMAEAIGFRPTEDLHQPWRRG
jgi:histidinol-phosphatase (PHP family)